jgi:proline iminopeptidase
MDAHYPVGGLAPREGHVPLGDASLYYRDVGTGPPVIVLHGGPSFDHHYLLPDMDRLSASFRLIYYDQRGRGASGGQIQPETISIQSEMDDLEALRQYLRLDSVAILGHSWGGLLAMEYALRHPQRVSHLILLNTSPASYDDCLEFQRQRDANAPEAAETLRTLRSRPELAAGDLEARAAYYRVYFQATLRPPALLDCLIQNLQVGWTTEDVLRAGAIGQRLWHETYESTGYNLLSSLTLLRIPTCIVHGDYDFIPLSCVTQIAEAIPGARLVVLRDCGHFSYLERPDEVHQALGELFSAS